MIGDVEGTVVNQALRFTLTLLFIYLNPLILDLSWIQFLSVNWWNETTISFLPDTPLFS